MNIAKNQPTIHCYKLQKKKHDTFVFSTHCREKSGNLKML